MVKLRNFLHLRLLAILIINLIISDVFTQRYLNNTWIFGPWTSDKPDQAIINELRFNDTGIVEIISYVRPAHVRQAISVLSDNSGKLKVWSNNCSVLNYNLDTLIGDYRLKEKRASNYCKFYGGWPFTGSVLILPWPGKEDLYQMFYTNDENIAFFAEYRHKPFASYLNGAEIDFRKKKEGEITKVWQLLYEDTITVSHLSACRHANGKDWWICTPLDAEPCYAIHTFSDTGYAFHHQQCIGKDTFLNHDAFGQACFSPNGKYFARYQPLYGLHLFKFSNKTGLFSDQLIIKSPIQPVVSFSAGICFSPNSRFLYQLQEGRVIYQYDLYEQDIISSRLLIDTLDISKATMEKITSFQYAALGPDGRIYITGNGNNTYLNVINRPNCKGKDCDLRQQAIKLPSRYDGEAPSMPHFIDWGEVYPDCVLTHIEKPNENFNNININVHNKILSVHVSDNLINSNLSILGIDGKLLGELTISNINEEFLLQDLALGLYFVKIEKGNLAKYFKIMIF